jgi:hypothetical protein
MTTVRAAMLLRRSNVGRGTVKMLAVQLPAVRLSSRRSCLLSEASIVVVARSFTVPMIFLFLVLFVDRLDGHGRGPAVHTTGW